MVGADGIAYIRKPVTFQQLHQLRIDLATKGRSLCP